MQVGGIIVGGSRAQTYTRYTLNNQVKISFLLPSVVSSAGKIEELDSVIQEISDALVSVQWQ